MEQDYCSSLKVAERFMFNSSVHLLTMFQSKLSSFTTTPSLEVRRKKKETEQQQHNVVEADLFAREKDLVKDLMNDSTKPIWNTVNKVDPTIVIGLPATPLEHNAHYFEDLFKFLRRFKNEHEDDSHMKIDIVQAAFTDPHAIVQQSSATAIAANGIRSPQQFARSLYSSLHHYIQTQINNLQTFISTQGFINAENQSLVEHFQRLHSFLKPYVHESNRQVMRAIDAEIKSLTDALSNVFDLKCFATAICLPSPYSDASEVLHPLLAAIFACLVRQADSISAKSRQQSMCPDPQLPEEDFSTNGASKVVLINLEGTEAECNLKIAKQLEKHLFYVSFPNEYFSNHDLATSQHSAAQYTSPQRESDEQRKNIYVYPVYSSWLTQQYGLPNIYRYQSYFIRLQLKELMGQIRQFNPSAIIITYREGYGLSFDHFRALLKQLTIIAGFRVVLYHRPNTMDAASPEFLLRLAAFIKISSGTHTLDQDLEENDDVDTFSHSRVLPYVARLLPLLVNNYPSLERLRNRCQQYEILAQVLNNKMKATGNPVQLIRKRDADSNELHSRLMAATWEILNEASRHHSQWGFGQIYPSIYLQIRSKINFQVLDKEWTEFLFEYCFRQDNQRIRTKAYFHLPHFPGEKVSQENQRALYFASFKIASEGLIQGITSGTKQQFKQQSMGESKEPRRVQRPLKNSHPDIELTADSQIYYDRNRRFRKALVYVTNLYRREHGAWNNYVGFIDETNKSKNKLNTEIELHPVIGLQPPKEILEKYLLQFRQFLHLCDFTYCETASFIFFLWPSLYDRAAAEACDFAGVSYVPISCDWVFRSRRDTPNAFEQLSIIYPFGPIRPRSRGYCLEPLFLNLTVPQIYIFGGFYRGTDDLFRFQTDVTIFRYDDSKASASIWTVPKSFYVELKLKNQETIVSKFKNDAVRPRICYQAIPHPSQPRTVLMVGGVGCLYLRPYSLLTTTYYKIQFKPPHLDSPEAAPYGHLESIRRQAANNIIPANLNEPVRCRPNVKMSMLIEGEGRNIFSNQDWTNNRSYCFWASAISYDHTKDQLNYALLYEYGQSNYYIKNRVEKTEKIPQGNVQVIFKRPRLNEFHSNIITVKPQRGRIQKVQLKLDLSMEARQAYPDLAETSYLTGQQMLSMDNFGKMLYVLVRDPRLTLGKCVLARMQVSEVTRQILVGQSFSKLTQKHQFSDDVSRTVLLMPRPQRVLFLHGLNFQPNVRVPEFVVRQNHNNETFEQTPIFPSDLALKLQDSSEFSAVLRLPSPLQCAFFLQQGHIVHCLSFKALHLTNVQQDLPPLAFAVFWQKFNVSSINVDGRYAWNFTAWECYYIEGSQVSGSLEIEFLDLKLANSPRFELILGLSGRLFKAQLNFSESLNRSNSMGEASQSVAFKWQPLKLSGSQLSVDAFRRLIEQEKQFFTARFLNKNNYIYEGLQAENLMQPA